MTLVRDACCPVFPTPNTCSLTAAMMRIGSSRPSRSRASHHAFRRTRTERHDAATTKPSPAGGTKSRSCSGGSRIGVGLPGGMIAVPMPFSDDLSRCNRHLLSQRMSHEPRTLCSKRIAGPWNLDGFGELLHDRVRTRSCRHSGVIGEICNSYLRRCDPICLDLHSV